MAEKKFRPSQGYTQQDWDDADSPELTDAELAEMRPFAEVFPDLAASIRHKREAGQDSTTRLISLRLSGEVIDKYKAGGAGWQSRIDTDLRKLNKIQ